MLNKRDLLRGVSAAGLVGPAALTRVALPMTGAAALAALLAQEAEAADQKLSALSSLGTVPDFYYGIRSTTSYKYNASKILNVKDFGATGDGVANDTTYIQDAVNAAFAIGLSSIRSNYGTIIFFPPGVYKVTAPIAFGASNASIHIEGAGRYSTLIYADDLAGYIIDKPNNGAQNLESIRSIGIRNGRLQVDGGAIRFCAAQTGIIDDCVIQGFVGVDATVATYCTRISNCIFTSAAPNSTDGTIGVAMGQVGLYNCRFQSFNIAIAVYNAGAIISGSAAEVCDLGIWVGGHRVSSQVTVTNTSPAVFTWTGVGGSGGDAGQNPYPLSNGSYVILASTVGLPPNFTIGKGYYVVNSETDGASKFRLEASPGSGAINAGGAGSGTHTVAGIVSNGIQGFAITGFQTERCSTGMLVYSASGGQIAGCTLTGTVGPGHLISTMSWSAGSGGVATVTTPAPHGLSTGMNVRIESVNNDLSNPHLWNVLSAVATVIDATHFSYPLGSDPGPYTIAGSGFWSRFCQYGIRVATSTGVIYSGLAVGVTVEQAAMDLFFGGSTQGVGNVMMGVDAGSWIMPTGISKASFQYINCTNVTPTMAFADLPGQAGVYTTAVEGQRYNITDGAKSGGGTAVPGDALQGAGVQHIPVYRTNSAWIYA